MSDIMPYFLNRGVIFVQEGASNVISAVGIADGAQRRFPLYPVESLGWESWGGRSSEVEELQGADEWEMVR